MGLKKMVACLVVALALSAVAASGAQAAWFIENVELGAAAKEDVKFAAMTPFTLTSTVAGIPVKITAQKLECAVGATCSIDGSNFGTDHSTAELTFTEVTVDEPGNCSIAGNAFTTKPLTDEIIMDPGGGAATFDGFFGEAATLVEKIEFVGATCPIAGAKPPLKGEVPARAENTGVAVVGQPLTFGAAQLITGGGNLSLGPAAATLSGEATVSLSGLEKGKVFGATA